MENFEVEEGNDNVNFNKKYRTDNWDNINNSCAKCEEYERKKRTLGILIPVFVVVFVV